MLELKNPKLSSPLAATVMPNMKFFIWRRVAAALRAVAETKKWDWHSNFYNLVLPTFGNVLLRVSYQKHSSDWGNGVLNPGHAFTKARNRDGYNLDKRSLDGEGNHGRALVVDEKYNGVGIVVDHKTYRALADKRKCDLNHDAAGVRICLASCYGGRAGCIGAIDGSMPYCIHSVARLAARSASWQEQFQSRQQALDQNPLEIVKLLADEAASSNEYKLRLVRARAYFFV